MAHVKEEESTQQTFTEGDKSIRFLSDQMFRKNGFFIHSRPSKGPVLWTSKEGLREGKTWTEEEVQMLIFHKNHPPK